MYPISLAGIESSEGETGFPQEPASAGIILKISVQTSEIEGMAGSVGGNDARPI